MFVGFVFLLFVVFLIRDIQFVIYYEFLVVIFGGVGIGVGIGIVYLGKGLMGGMVLVVQIIYKYLGLLLGMCFVFIDGLIVVIVMIVFNIE